MSETTWPERIEKLAALDDVLNALASDADVHSTAASRIAKAKEGHLIINAIRESAGHRPIVAKLDTPLETIPAAPVAFAPEGGLAAAPVVAPSASHEESPAAIKTKEMLAEMDADL